MSRADNQTTRVLAHLMSGRSITSMQAIELYGCTRLADKIHKLRKAGYDIVTLQRDGVTRYGDACTYAEYRMREIK